VKVVIDTNILWVSISSKSSTHWVVQHLLAGTFTLCVTSEILQEYEEIIGQQLGQKVATTFMELLENLNNVEEITRYYSWLLIHQDPDDNKFVDCAIAANAQYLATNDKHFNVVKAIPFPKVNIVNAQEFYDILNTL
jgi:putative PIN family toxin of toxin-antitoxin system